LLALLIVNHFNFRWDKVFLGIIFIGAVAVVIVW